MARDEELFDEEEFEDEAAEDDFEEFDEDFEAAGAGEVKIKTVSGMDTFCVVWSFFATVGALVIVSYFLLYEIYDLRMGGIFPEKDKPAMDSSIPVLDFGRDPKISDTYNYAILGRGRIHGIEPGMIVYIADPSAGTAAQSAESAWVVMVVTDECEASICRANIIRIKTNRIDSGSILPRPSEVNAGDINADPVLRGSGSSSAGDGAISVVPPAGGAAAARRFNDWSQIDVATEATNSMPLLIEAAAENRLRANTAPWEQQVYIRTVEEKYAEHKRKTPGR